MFRRYKGLIIHTVSRYLSTKPDNYSYQGQSKLTQQDARNKWLEDNPLDPVVQDRTWLAARAAGSSGQPLSHTFTRVQ